MTTDAGGAALVPAAALPTLAPRAPHLRVPAQEFDERAPDLELWVYRMIDVDVSVRFEEARGEVPEAVEIEPWICVGERGINPAKAEPPWSIKWLSDHQLRGARGPVETPYSGPGKALRVAVPRIRGLTITARRAGWTPAAARVAVDARTDAASAELVMRRPDVVAGGVLDEHGAPVADASVSVYVGRRVPPSELDFEPYQALGHAVTWRWNPKLTEGYLTFSTSAATKSDGRFRAELHASGTVIVEARAPGRRPVRVRLDSGAPELTDLRVQLAPPVPRSTLMLTDGGAPVVGVHVRMIDTTLEFGRRIVLSGRADETGSIDSTVLEPGGSYFAEFSWRDDGGQVQEVSGHLQWTGAKTLDIRKDLREQP